MSTHAKADEPSGEVLLVLEPSAPRLFVAIASLALLAFFLIALAISPAPFLGRVFLIVLGLGTLWMAWTMAGVRGRSLELTAAGLREAPSGKVIAEVASVVRVERGAFAFKPSSGFLIVLKDRRMPSAWVPGLWWRLGRRAGVGGVVGSGQARAVAEMLDLLREKASD
ncbi:MAG: hypothetical protein AAFX00_09210 [Pseudomonadota bacterium]